MLVERHEGVDACDGSCKRCEPSGNQSLTKNLEGFEPPRTEYDSNSLPPTKKMEAKFGKWKVSAFPAVENHNVHLNFGGGGPV